MQIPSSEANWFAARQEIPRILWNPNVHHRTHKRPLYFMKVNLLYEISKETIATTFRVALPFDA